jgi:hypothetical protein
MSVQELPCMSLEEQNGVFSPHNLGGRRTSPKTNEITKRTIKMMNKIRAISTEIAAILVKPKNAATMAIIRNASAQPSILPSCGRDWGQGRLHPQPETGENYHPEVFLPKLSYE